MMLAACFALMRISPAFGPAPARADDGGVSFGGSPRLLSGHQSVSMQSEVIQMQVGPVVKVDCQFVFHNAGPACTVRMGFPDEGRGADGPEEDGPERSPHGTFLSYVSFVDGVRVPTQTVRAQEASNFWHVKTVTFAAGQTRRVHDVYSLYVGSQIADHPNSAYHQTYYILHTASSWHGPIGRAEIVVTFAPGESRPPLKLIPLSSLPNNDPQKVNWAQVRPGTVVYRGPAKPTVRGNTLRFLRANLRPAYADDVLLYFHFDTTHPD